MRREFGFNLHAQSDEVGGCDPEPPLPLAQKSLLAQLLVKSPEQTVENERVSAEAGQLSWELSRQTERQTAPQRRRTDGGGESELSGGQIFSWLVWQRQKRIVEPNLRVPLEDGHVSPPSSVNSLCDGRNERLLDKVKELRSCL